MESFYDEFNSEQDCIIFLKEKIEQENLFCTKCKKPAPRWNCKRNHWKCSGCSKIMTPKSLSFFKHSKISLYKWFQAIYEFFNTTNSISNIELGRRLEINRYATVLYLAHKIRKQMSFYNSRNKFSVFFDYALSKRSCANSKSEFEKKKVKLLLSHKENRSAFRFQYFNKASNASKVDLNSRIKKIKVKFLTSLSQKKAVELESHNPTLLHENYIERIIKEVHRGVSNQHLQYYLDEYCFKNNKRLKTISKASFFTENLVS